jgi:hypothetical protein
VVAQLVLAGLDPVPLSDIDEILATLLDPRQLGALHGSLAAHA